MLPFIITEPLFDILPAMTQAELEAKISEQEHELLLLRDKLIGTQNVNKNLQLEIIEMELKYEGMKNQLQRFEKIAQSLPWRILRKVRLMFKKS